MRGLLDRGRSKGSYFGGPPGHSSSSLTSIQGKLGPLTLGVDEEGWLEDEGSPEGSVSASGSSVTQGASAPTSSNTLSRKHSKLQSFGSILGLQGEKKGCLFFF